MGVTEYVLRHPFLLALGWALVHFLWQGAIVGGVAAVLLRAGRSAAASTRYAIATMAMMVMVVCAAGTWLGLARPIGAARTAAGQGLLEGRVFPVINGAGKPAQAAGSHGVAAGSEDPALHGVTPPSAPSTSARTIDATQSSQAPLALSIVLALYTLGVLLLSIRLAGGWYLARRLTRRGVTAAGADLVAIGDRVADRLALRRLVRVLESSLVTAPAIIGWIAPVVLLPAAALAGLSRAQLEALIAHELAHVKRHDYLVNLLQSAVETLLFYHPAVWWVSRQIRIEREHCCDDVAVAVCGDRIVYATALKDLETMRGAAMVLAATDGSLASRVRRILSPPAQPRGTAPGWMGLVLLLVLAGIPAVMSTVRANPTGPADQSPTTSGVPSKASPPAPVADPATVVEETSPSVQEKPAAPVIHANDVLRVKVAGDAALSRDYPVQADGVAVLPLLRPMKVAGLTTDSVARSIAAALEQGTAPGAAQTVAEMQQQQNLGAIYEEAKGAAASGVARRRMAQDAMDRLGAYNVADPKTDLENCGVLNEPELRGDSEVLALRDALRSLRAKLIQRTREFGPQQAEVLELKAQIADNLSQLRAVTTSALATARTHLVLARNNEEIARAEQEMSWRRFADASATSHPSAVPSVTVTIVKSGNGASSPQTTPTAAPPQDESCPAALKPGPGVKNPILQREVKPLYPDWAEQQGMRGVVELEVTVTPAGTTCGIAVTKSLEPRLDAEAIKAARGWRFTPAESNGALVPIRVGIEMTFSGKPQSPVTVVGAVKNPGTAVRFGAGSTLLDVVNLAGGVATEGGEPGPPTFRIERLDPATGKTIAIEAQASTIVQPGDVVTVRIPKDAGR